VAVSFIGGGNRFSHRKPPTCQTDKTLSHNVVSSECISAIFVKRKVYKKLIFFITSNKILSISKLLKEVPSNNPMNYLIKQPLVILYPVLFYMRPLSVSINIHEVHDLNKFHSHKQIKTHYLNSSIKHSD
jgi:hypothetical protein